MSAPNITNNAGTSLPLAASTGSLPPSMSTRSMSPDRGQLGKIVGHLYIAGKILIEGRARPIEEIRHEIRAMMTNAAAPQSAGQSSSSGPSSPAGNVSLHSWLNLVTSLIRQTAGIPTTISSLPDEIKKELAGLIKQGKSLCSASADACMHVGKATDKYLKLSGVSYL